MRNTSLSSSSNKGSSCYENNYLSKKFKGSSNHGRFKEPQSRNAINDLHIEQNRTAQDDSSSQKSTSSQCNHSHPNTSKALKQKQSTQLSLLNRIRSLEKVNKERHSALINKLKLPQLVSSSGQLK